MSNDLDNFTRGYLEAALWASNDDAENPLDARYSIDDFDAETKATARTLCEQFMAENETTLDLYCERVTIVDDDAPMAYAGHDLWLTRCGHGAGFWDRGLGDIGERLADAAHKLGEANAWETADVCELHIDGTAEIELRETATRVAAVHDMDADIAATQAADAIERDRAQHLSTSQKGK